MRKTFKVRAPAEYDIPGNLILRLEFTPPPLLPWDWVRGAIEAILRAWYSGAEITWEGTTANIIVRDWMEAKFNTAAAKTTAAEYIKQREELME